ncbi:hypothetical protein POM88_035422 [Heracleum sosnowskyi]|uniref:Uncharacterized protein n=1 Tax=Heracleum sosnowskyi TaxID=360622 RepID=A0AAD8MBJ3_9APIA|nr:hypothetical protein POM88_035422 [Heracleum sosnowskyi]
MAMVQGDKAERETKTIGATRIVGSCGDGTIGGGVNGDNDDFVGNDYKVVYVATVKEQPLVGDIYSCNSCKAGCWRKIALSKYCHRGIMVRNQENITRNHGVSKHLTVISFDVRFEVFSLLPDSYEKESGKDVVLMNMKDSVVVMFYDWTLLLGSAADVHIFDERCNVWSKTEPDIDIHQGNEEAQRRVRVYPPREVVTSLILSSE